ncbi:hypothetical protein [Bacillus sp. 1P06AnD]|uniref:hypothetical protein n=1 Tax=Bacillus sp. 1P06AnD TaxID=3132208 RepID=UPI0039A39BBF
MKKLVYIAAAFSLLSLTACGKDEEKTSGPTSTETENTQSHNADSAEYPKGSKHDRHETDSGDKSSSTATNHQAQPSTSNQTGTQEKSLTEKEVISQVKNQIQGGLTPKLPTHIPISEGKHLSAATVSDASMYRVIFFESDKAIPINNKQLNNAANAKPIATVEAHKYTTEKKALEQIGYMSPKEINTGNSPVQLGASIKGYGDAGAGNKWLNWHEGRWYMQVHASNIEGNSDYTPLAKKMVAYLEKNTLPIPHAYGSVKADVEADKAENNRVSWQEGTIVYTVSNVTNPLDMLAIATHFDATGQ